MNQLLLGNIWFLLISILWIAYVVQEAFIVGASMLSIFFSKDEGERKQIQVSTGLHWDGIEVWFITAVGATFASFPLAFAVTFEFLYIPVFLLLYALISRGIGIELLYKSESLKWRKNVGILWSVSSLLIALIIGVYLVTITLGVPIGPNGIEGSFLTIFNIPGLAGGLLIVTISLVMGSGFIEIITKGDLGAKSFDLLRKTGIYVLIPLLTLIVYFGANHKDTSMFGNGLYIQYHILFVLPILSVLAGLLTALFVYKDKRIKSFISGIVTVVTYLATLFVGAFPYLLASTISHEYSISVSNAMASQKTLMVMFVSAVIFVPLVIGYQTWKYFKFAQKVNYMDREEA